MSTIKAEDILNRASLALFDETGVRWTPEELLEHLSDGQRECVILKPSSNPRNEVVQLDPGTKQSIPADGMTLIDVVRSMGSDGETPGRAIRQVQREVLDSTRPNWHSEDADGTPVHWMFDNRDPKNFYLTPPQPSPAHHVELIYAATPAEIDDLNDLIELDDAYQTPLLYYVMSRALMKATSTQDIGKAAQYYELFRSVLEGREVSSDRMHPGQLQRRAETRFDAAAQR